MTTELNPGFTRAVVEAFDATFLTLMTAVTGLLPDFGQFSSVDYVAHGFDIPADLVLVQLVTVLGYLAAVFAVGYFCLRTREVAR